MRGDLPRADAEPLVDAEDEEGGEPLRRRREIVEGDRRQPQRQRLDGARAEGLQVAARDGAADPLQVGGDLAADIAAIEIVEPGSREMGERVGERRTLAHRAGRRRLAVDEKRLGEAGRPMPALPPRSGPRALPRRTRDSPRARGAPRQSGARKAGSWRRGFGHKRGRPASPRRLRPPSRRRPARAAGSRRSPCPGSARSWRGCRPVRTPRWRAPARPVRARARRRRRRPRSCADRRPRSSRPWPPSPRGHCRPRRGWRVRPRRRGYAARRRPPRKKQACRAWITMRFKSVMPKKQALSASRSGRIATDDCVGSPL